ncbi:MAG TPA: IS701 family transposase [Candidatus Dormibacteraeota bacterium]|nr:IS701 family transposase [Candidatus Dormibacteraeota bacterium]
MGTPSTGWWTVTTLDDLERWGEAFSAFHARFADLFARRESREQMAKYLRGLLAPVERKNSWQVAEAVGDATPDRMQRLLYRVDWDVDAARDRLQAFVRETFGDPEGIGVLDETGFLKKGTASVGVQRQRWGTAGKVENCQIGVFLSYATPRGHVLLDRRLYLPEAWCEDPARRARAKVPEEVGFQTKPELAIAMLEHAWAQGVPMRWVTGDEVYGDAPRLRETIERHGRGYVLTVSSTTPVWTERPPVGSPSERAPMGSPVVGPSREPGDRPRTRARRASGAPPATTVGAVVAGWPAEAWQRLAVAEGEQGLRVSDWGRARVIEQRDRLPGPEVWLLARRSLSDPDDLAYYLALAPTEVSLQELATVAATRSTAEQCLEEAKRKTGLDQYEVRHWPSWYRHITLSMLAHAWLAAIRSQAEVRQGGVLPA